MKKVLLVLLPFLFLCSTLFSQEKSDKEISTFDSFIASQAGAIISIESFDVTSMKSYGKVIYSEIRKVTVGELSELFAYFTVSNDYLTYSASLDWDDFVDLVNALETLREESKQDLTGKDVTMKFVSTDNTFVVGWNTYKNKPDWFIRIDREPTRIGSLDKILLTFSELEKKFDEVKFNKK